MNSKIRSLVALVVSVGSCFLVGGAAAFVTATSVRDWYPLLEKPSWTPPNALFGPVWSTLYLLMGIAAWLIWRDSDAGRRTRALLLFAIQLVLNGIWSFIFFGLRSPGWAAPEIVLLWCTIVATVVVFARINRLAAGLLVPYLVWVSYAMALNIAVWSLNR